MLRDLRQDAYDGRVYLPQDRLTAHNVTLEDLRGREVAPRLKAALREFRDAVQEELQSALASVSAPLRPLAVLGALHRRLLDRIAAHDFDSRDVAHRPGPDREAMGRVADSEKPFVVLPHPTCDARGVHDHASSRRPAAAGLSGVSAERLCRTSPEPGRGRRLATDSAPRRSSRLKRRAARTVDAAHGNFHTIDGRFAAFAALLRADGYRVASADQPISSALLAAATSSSSPTQ